MRNKSALLKIGRAGLIISIVLIIFAFVFFEFRGIEAVSEYPLIEGAHRGDSVDYKENTIDAFRAALNDSQYKFIEFDIQYTKDKEIVVFHDYTLLRMQMQFRRISNMDYDELCEVSKFSIPTYKEVMDTIGNKTKINIEIKSQGDFEDDKILADYVIDDCKQRGVLSQVVISSVSKDVIKYISDKYPEVETGIVYWISAVTYVPSEWLINQFYEEVESIGADYVMLHGTNVKNYELLTRLKPKDTKLAFWYFNNKMFILKKDSSDGLW